MRSRQQCPASTPVVTCLPHDPCQSSNLFVGTPAGCFLREAAFRTLFKSLPLLRHQHLELAATRCATPGGAPSARSSRYIVRPRFQCLR